MNKTAKKKQRECKRCGGDPSPYIWYCADCQQCDKCGRSHDQLKRAGASIITRHDGMICTVCDQIRIQRAVEKHAPRIAGGDDLDVHYTPEIVCPYCLYTFSDSWEIEPGDSETECPECGNEFAYSRDVEVTYSTHQINPAIQLAAQNEEE